MPSIRSPRKGSMQVWPRKRAASETPRVRSWPEVKDVKALGFAGYKAGMTHMHVVDNKKNSTTKGDTISVPVTIIECPPVKVAGIRAYKINDGAKVAAKEVIVQTTKELSRKIIVSKDKKTADEIEKEIDSFSNIMLIVHTQPKLTGIGKKKPEIFEVAIGGKDNKEKFNYAKELLGKDISVSDIFQAGDVLDTKAVTKGKGFQGPVKRFGVSIRSRKSEKTKRGPGSLGGWIAQGHSMYRIAHAGQMGYHLRTDYNKQILAVSDKPEDINPKGGIVRYGVVKNSYILIKGSVGGPKKRLVRFNFALREKNNRFPTVPEVKSISLESQQGR